MLAGFFWFAESIRRKQAFGISPGDDWSREKLSLNAAAVRF
jgi:hypothetical protein